MILFSSFFRRKSIEEIILESERSNLKKVLNALDLTWFGIGAIVGAGIFALVGTASSYSGPAVIISFIIASIACLFTALSYAEFSSSIPISGSAYSYAFVALGEFIAFLVGWNLILEYLVGNMVVAISWSSYFKTLLSNLNINVDFGNNFDFFAFSISLFVSFIILLGIKETARFNNILVITKILILLFFILIGLPFINFNNFQPFAPYGISGILTGSALIFFAYIGFDAVSTTAEEVKNPKRDLPIGIIGSLLISTILYIAVCFVLLGISNYKQLNVADPLARALNYINLEWASSILAIGALISTTTVLLVFQAGQPRIFYSMARDGLLPNFFAYIHPKFKTPYISIILCGLIVAVFSALVDISVVAELTNIGTLFVFLIINVGSMYSRLRGEFRPVFKTPFFPIIQVFGIISCLILMLSLPTITWIRFLVWLALGLLIYFLLKLTYVRTK
ncbi:MAG: amino acid permease [candidate division WOR-3 bacterium]|nr:amino acid permease [candidate division WOR-3 bacterium]MDW8150664.1 amino acid permease [candidate division WOR-3 bacterium]